MRTTPESPHSNFSEAPRTILGPPSRVCLSPMYLPVCLARHYAEEFSEVVVDVSTGVGVGASAGTGARLEQGQRHRP
jgi:hypothetical protein